MKFKTIFIFLLTMIFMLLINTNVLAIENTIKIQLGDDITVNGEKITTDTSSEIYFSSNMNNGGSSYKSKAENLEIGTVININKAGNYEFSGEQENVQISVNSNNIDGEVKIILDNASITCEDAPAIFVYSKDLNNKNCIVNISTKENTENTIKGARIKTSVKDFEDQSQILYYIEKDTDDDGEYYERYKYDGAISSDIDLVFEGDGVLNIESLEKEGIEGKGDIIINSGTIIINSLDDSINACTDGESDITINGGKVVAFLKEEAEEGDGIDSNGSLTVNGGVVYAFACPGGDNGLDADQGVIINGGEILAIGGMYEPFKTTNDYKFIQLNLSKQAEKGDVIVIVDEDEQPVYAFESDRSFSTIAASKDFENENYKLYLGAKVTGEKDEYGIYRKIDSIDLENATLQENTGNAEMKNFDKIPGRNGEFQTQLNSNIETPLIIVGIVLLITILLLDLKFNNKAMKIVNLIFGIIIATLVVSGIFLKTLPNMQMQSGENQRQNFKQMQEAPHEMPIGDRMNQNNNM